MQVETYECQETMDETVEATEEAIGILESLGLEGQKKLLSPDTDEPTRCPYREIRADEIFVYERLCPQKTKLAEYDASPIPLRVLQVAAHATSLGIYHHLTVWSAQGAIKDPVLVAHTTADSWNTGHATHILARWGEVLDAWPILTEKAIAVWRDFYRGKLAEMSVKIKTSLECLDSFGIEEARKRTSPYLNGVE